MSDRYAKAPEGYKYVFSKYKTVNGKKIYKKIGWYVFLVENK